MPPKPEKPSGTQFSRADAVSLSRPLLAVLANQFEISSRRYRGLMLVAFASDALDGYLATHDERSKNGDLIDILSDHLTESIMYSKLVNEGVVPPAVLAVTSMRMAVVDTIRVGRRMFSDEESWEDSFSVGESQLGQAVTTSRISRIGYALIKTSIPQLAGQYPEAAKAVSIGATAVSMIRALPVFLRYQSE